MHPIARVCTLFACLALAQHLLAQTQPIKIFGLVELSGTGATSGTNFNDGAKLAVKEINAAGGILGRKDRVPRKRHAIATASSQVARGTRD